MNSPVSRSAQPPAASAHGAGRQPGHGSTPEMTLRLNSLIGNDAVMASPAPHDDIAPADWDVMFAAVKTRLREAVGEHLGVLPQIPSHSALLSASLVQATVLDCVSALDQLHAALKQERSQRPTA